MNRLRAVTCNADQSTFLRHHKKSHDMEIFGENLNASNEVKSGYLLLAEPMLFDPNFQRTVVLVCEHNDTQGTFGLVLNKEAQVLVDNSDKHPYLKDNLYTGGPVQPNTLHYIHTLDTLEGAVPIRNGVYWGGSYEHLIDMHGAGMVGAQNCRFFIGYSGWSSGQLDEELGQNSWVISKVDLSVVFNVPPEALWMAILKQMGGKYRMFTNYPLDPSMN